MSEFALGLSGRLTDVICADPSKCLHVVERNQLDVRENMYFNMKRKEINSRTVIVLLLATSKSSLMCES